MNTTDRATELARQIVTMLNTQRPEIEWPFQIIRGFCDAALTKAIADERERQWQPMNTLASDAGWVLACWDDYAMSQAANGTEELPYNDIASRVSVITAYFAKYGIGREHLIGWQPCPDPPAIHCDSTGEEGS